MFSGDCSRAILNHHHRRVHHTPPQTPDGFYDVGINTQMSADIKDKLERAVEPDPAGNLGMRRKSTNRGQYEGRSILGNGKE
jgi:hypothetical protein